MPEKTLSDCAACPVIRYCDAHVIGGEWQHSGGVNPCRISLKEKKTASLIDAETANTAIRIRANGQQFKRVNGTTAEEFLAEVGI